ncbi:MAG TPA: LysR substrate-binding domain-containing protein [Lysobacter sp.]|nr:LysR substrate-binding domain-containing protein [Lysobacter sp.]
MGVRADWLSALAAFESAARHQNFAHAAEELHLTASAVSHQVRKLEARLGVTLFQRHARGVALTAAGRQLADAAGTALADLDSVLGSLRAGRDRRQRLRITTLHSLTYTWLLPRLPDFTRAHPDIRLDIETDIALTRFDEGGPDLGIRHGPGQWPGLAAIKLMEDCLFPVASPRFPGLAAVKAPADIARLPLIADRARQGWHDWFRAAGVHGARVDTQFSFTDTTDALNAAAVGLGVTLARRHIAQPYIDRGQLVALPGPPMPARWAYYIVYPTHRKLREPAARFIEWLQAIAAA